MPRLRLQQALVVGQIALLMLLLIGAGLFVRTLSNLQSVSVGFNQDNVLLFELNAPQAGRPPATVAAFYDDLRQRFAEIPGVRAVTLSHCVAAQGGPRPSGTVDGVVAEGTRFMQTGPGFFSTMQIPMLQGREIDERDAPASLPVVVVSDAVRADVHAEPESAWPAHHTSSAAPMPRDRRDRRRRGNGALRPHQEHDPAGDLRAVRAASAAAAADAAADDLCAAGPTAIRCATSPPSGRSSTTPIRACR